MKNKKTHLFGLINLISKFYQRKSKPIIYFFIFIFVLGTFSVYFTRPVLSAPIVTITPLSADTNTSVDYCFGWNSQDLDVTTDIITIAFPKDPEDVSRSFDLSGVTISDTIADTEVYFYIGSSDCSSGGRPGEAPLNNQPDRDLVFGFEDDEFIYVNIRIDDDAVIADDTPISIGFVAKAGNTVVTPQTAGNYEVSILQYLEGSDPIEMNWWDTQLLYIGGLNEVDISGSVDPTLTLSIVSSTSDAPVTTCNLGDLADYYISTCSYRSKITTNGSNGYTSYLREMAQMQNSNGDLIPYPVADVIEEGTAGYGVATTASFIGQDINQLDDADGNLAVETDDCDYIGVIANNVTSSNFTALSSLDQSYGHSAGAVSDHYTTLCHGASISPDTEGGVYTYNVEITVVANF